MSPLPELLTLLALAGAFAAALRFGLRPQTRGRSSPPARPRNEVDANPYRAVRILPAQSFRAPGGLRQLEPLASSRLRRAATGESAPADLPAALPTDWVRRLLGARYTLVAEVPLVDLVRFDHPRYGSPSEHRELRVRTAPWVIGERASGRVRLVVAPPAGLRGAIAGALERDGVAVWSFARWRREVRSRDAIGLRNALVRDGLPVDPPEPSA